MEVAVSRGGVLAVTDPVDNLVTTGIPFWPPSEIVQKLYQSRQVRAFDEPDLGAVTRTLSFYSDLQSLHSEDSITWSVFGTLAYSNPLVQCAFVESLLKLLKVPTPSCTGTNIWLWRRIPHPDTLAPGGPEIDFGIQTEHTIILGEAKWLSNVGQMQGKARNKDQIILRREFLEKYGKLLYGKVSNYILLGLSLHGGMLQEETLHLGHAVLHIRDTTWEKVCSIESHPASEEFRRYLDWKTANSKQFLA
jgi:hypothetical protein